MPQKKPTVGRGVGWRNPGGSRGGQITARARLHPPYAIGVNLDIFWLKDDTLDDPDLLPPPDEIVENLEAALDRFGKVTPARPAGSAALPPRSRYITCCKMA
jgi:hypothetical protein